jgi:hypothetical protein
MPQLDQDYVFLPQRLLADLQANPAAIGVYALIARLFLIYQEPIPLSAADLQRYDPTLSYGAARGALQRLVTLHWLNEQPGHKNCYTPAWGLIKGITQPWRLDAPTLGRPAHVPTLRFDRRLLDVGLGKLVPHPTYPAQTRDRYLEQPILSLRDVGSYAQALAGRSIVATTALLHYELIRNGQAQPLPSSEALIALASQRTLAGDGAPPTEQGRRKLGLETSSASLAIPPVQPLFFVDRDLIPNPITCSIPDLIPSSATHHPPSSAAECAESQEETYPLHMAGTSGILSETSDSPPNPPTSSGGGGKDQHMNKKFDQGAVRPETEAATLLRSINAFPSSIIELATMPVELVGRAIAYAQSEPGIASIPGWVIEALRRHRDEGWLIPVPCTRPLGLTTREQSIAVETYTSGAYGDLFRLGSDTTGLEDSALDPVAGARVPTGIGAMAYAPAEPVVQPEQPTDTLGVISAAQAPAEPILRTEIADDAITQHVQDELSVRCSRQRDQVIAGLRIHLAGGTTLIICATSADMVIIQRELLGALQCILVGLGAPLHLVFTTRAGWAAQRDRARNARSRPSAPAIGVLSLP